jgi:hypothetical protein
MTHPDSPSLYSGPGWHLTPQNPVTHERASYGLGEGAALSTAAGCGSGSQLSGRGSALIESVRSRISHRSFPFADISYGSRS